MASAESTHTLSAAPVSRRNVTKGLAWSSPAVGMVAAAPSYAISGTACTNAVPTQTSLISTAGTKATFRATSSTGQTYTVTVTTQGVVNGQTYGNPSAPSDVARSYNMTVGSIAINGGRSATGDVSSAPTR